MNIIQKVDKLTLLMIEKSFSSRSIKSEDDIALYFKLMDSFCKKLSFCVKSIKTIKSHYIQNPLALGMEIEAVVLDASLNNLSRHCKMVLGHFMKILDLQPLLFTHIYKYYLEICFDIFFNCNLFEQCVLQKTVRCLENVIDTEENCPTEKLVNFPDQRKLFEDQHNEIFTPANVKRVLSFLAINFMAKCSIEDHENKPESPQCTILPDLLI